MSAKEKIEHAKLDDGWITKGLSKEEVSKIVHDAKKEASKILHNTKYYVVVNCNNEFYYYGYESNPVWGIDLNKAKIYKDSKWATKIVNTIGKDKCKIATITINYKGEKE